MPTASSACRPTLSKNICHTRWRSESSTSGPARSRDSFRIRRPGTYLTADTAQATRSSTPSSSPTAWEVWPAQRTMYSSPLLAPAAPDLVLAAAASALAADSQVVASAAVAAGRFNLAYAAPIRFFLYRACGLRQGWREPPNPASLTTDIHCPLSPPQTLPAALKHATPIRHHKH